MRMQIVDLLLNEGYLEVQLIVSFAEQSFCKALVHDLSIRETVANFCSTAVGKVAACVEVSHH